MNAMKILDRLASIDEHFAPASTPASLGLVTADFKELEARGLVERVKIHGRRVKIGFAMTSKGIAKLETQTKKGT